MYIAWVRWNLEGTQPALGSPRYEGPGSGSLLNLNVKGVGRRREPRRYDLADEVTASSRRVFSLGAESEKLGDQAETGEETVEDIPTGALRGIDALAKALVDAGHMTAVKKKQVDAWRAIRKAAAHGEHLGYEAADVRRLLDGVRDFIADELG